MNKDILKNLYINNKKSAKEIADIFNFSQNKVNYWINKYAIKKRSISDAVYVKNNPKGDPFRFARPRTREGAMLMGFGLGLYWGEGTKADKNSVRLGNTDPELISLFVKFLTTIFLINKNNLRFSLQIFSDMPKKQTLDFWVKKLRISKHQFYKTTITPYRSVGTYRTKSKYGVLIVYFHNKKLRNKLMDLMETESKFLLSKYNNK